MRALLALVVGYVVSCLIFAALLPPAWAVLATVALTVVTGSVVLFGGCFVTARRMRYQYLAGVHQVNVQAELGTRRAIDP